MAHNPQTIITLPELDSKQGAFQIELTTRKYSNGEMVSSATGEFARDGMVTYLMYGDFRKVYARTAARATQRALDAQHAATFSPAALPQIIADARAFYAARHAEESRAA